MRTSWRRRGAIGGVIGLVTAGAMVLLPASPAAAVAQTNACTNTATPNATQLDTDLTGTAPASVSPGASFTLSGLNLSLFLPGDIFVAGYNLGLLNSGDVVPGNVRAVIEGTNTVEGTQSTDTVPTSVGPIIINDPDGIRGSGDESAAPINVSVGFADQTWTAGASGTISFREDTVPLGVNSGGIVINATVGGIISIQFRCSPGTVTGPDPGVITLTDPAASFAMTQIVVPDAAPVAVDDSASVGAGQSVSVNVVANDTDVNGNLDPSTVTIVTPPTAGTATPNPDGTVTYTNTDATALTDSFTYTVADTTALVSNAATVSISILGDTCDATVSPCSLDQVIEVQVIGASMTMQQAGALVSLNSITLNGQPQTTTGALNGLTVLNARGTDAGWSLTGDMTGDFGDGTGDGVCPASDPSTWDNHCIPGDNLGWTPSASVAHQQIPGDVAQVNAGAAVSPDSPGLGSAQALCSSPANHSGGTFSCGGGVSLAIPASAAAGTYSGTLTLTLA
ncbi:MAG TPA: Ig-like domain-containing protein [Acidimicrobiales bacterium]|nr:Ig-like domain-containing protein [Acidimicrobiales bacterium]